MYRREEEKMDMKEIRARIDQVDDELVRLYGTRIVLVRASGG